jgi:PAS domain S-box-containing protein
MTHTHAGGATEASATGFFSRLLDTDFMPRSECVAGRAEIIWLHVASDSLIALAYCSIPLALLYFVYRRKDLAFNWMFVLFALFILACGTTHVMGVVAFWRPMYRLDGLIKVLTAGLSLATAAALWPLVTRAMTLPSTGQLKEANARLEREIAERRRVEDDLERRVDERTRALAESEQRKSAILESALDSIITMDQHGRIVEFNPASERAFGYTRDEAVGRTVEETIIPPALRPAHRQGLERFLSSRGGPVVGRRIEMTAMRAGGAEFPVELAITPTALPGGGLLFTAYIRDITERKRAEEALRQSETNYRFLAESIPQIVWTARPDGVTTYTNKRLNDFTGMDSDELRRAGWIGIRHAQDRAPATEAWERSLRTGEPYEAIYRLRAADGTYRWHLARAMPLTDADGKVLRWFGTCTDIDDQRRAQHALEESEERLQLAMEAARMGAWDWHIGSGRVVWSATLQRVRGLPAGSFGGAFEDFQAGIHPEDRERAVQLMHGALNGRTEYQTEYRIVRPDGGIAWVEARGRLSLDERGQPARMAGICMDITVRKRAEEELARHREQLEDLVRDRTAELVASQERVRLSERMAALGTLSAGLGHDMGNLLMPVRMRLEAIETEGLSPELRTDLQAIGKSAEYLQRLAGGLRMLALDPDEAGRQGQVTRLEDWWTDAQPLLRNLLPRGVVLECSLPPDLPAAGIARHALMQAVFNLVQNAADALRPRGSGRVRISATAHHGRVHVHVSDDGPGMTAEIRRRCMEPFFTTRPRSLSTGLGLALVHSVIQKAGGAVEIETEPGRGTTFTLSLPVAPAVPPAGKAALRAAVSLGDPRLLAYIIALLRGLGFDPVKGEPLSVSAARLWITEPADEFAQTAKMFLAGLSGRRVVVIGDLPQGIAVPDVIVLPGPLDPVAIRRVLNGIAAEFAGDGGAPRATAT